MYLVKLRSFRRDVVEAFRVLHTILLAEHGIVLQDDLLYILPIRAVSVIVA